jgi:hypothetical protein
MGAGFFAVDLQEVEKMARAELGGDVIAAYVVLCRGVNSRYGRTSSHGAKSVATRCGVTYRQAEQHLQTLGEFDAITSESDNRRKPKWRLREPVSPVYLPNALTDGVGHGEPPLSRIINRTPAPFSGARAGAKADALMVMLNLYREDDMGGAGGVDPRTTLSTIWSPAENSLGHSIMPLEGTNGFVIEVEEGGSSVFRKFADRCLGHITDNDERYDRFWQAFNTLKRESLIYQVVMVWSSDPTKRRDAEPEYCLYILDHHARKADPFLQYEVHRAMLRTFTVDPYSEFSSDDYDDNAAIRSGRNAGRFRFITASKAGVAVGTWRLRFRAATRDSAIGWQRELDRNATWKDAIDALKAR